MRESVLAVVVTYNRCHLLAGCLQALRTQTVPCDILVVDNASTDDTGRIVQPFLDAGVRYYRMARNTGGAGGFNQGMRMGAEADYHYIWIMDDDAFPEPDALEALVRAAGAVHDSFGFLSSRVLWVDGTLCRMNRQKFMPKYRKQAYAQGNGLRPVTQATFVSCFIRSETVRAEGLPIAEFFIWGDDIEYTRRLAVRKKLNCYLVENSVVIHHTSGNVGSDISRDDLERLDRYGYAYRNENYLYRQEGIAGVLHYCARCGLHLARIWLRGRDHRRERSRILIKSFISGWSFDPQVEFIREEQTTSYEV